jgi:hypothetical protein
VLLGPGLLVDAVAALLDQGFRRTRIGDGVPGPLRPLAHSRSSYAMHPWLNDSE